MRRTLWQEIKPFWQFMSGANMKIERTGNTIRVYLCLESPSETAYIQSVEIAKNDPSYIKIHTLGNYRPEDKEMFIEALKVAYEIAFEEDKE